MIQDTIGGFPASPRRSKRMIPLGSIVLTPSDARALYQAARIGDLRNMCRVGNNALYTLLTDLTICAFSDNNHADIGNLTRQLSASEEHKEWTVNQLSKASNRAPRTIRLDIEKGTLPAKKHGKTWIITAREANTYIASRRPN